MKDGEKQNSKGTNIHGRHDYKPRYSPKQKQCRTHAVDMSYPTGIAGNWTFGARHGIMGGATV